MTNSQSRIELFSGNEVQWNACAKHPLQSWQWGEARIATGVKVMRVAQYDRTNQLTHVFTLTLHTIPYTNYTIGYIPRSVFPTKELCEYLITHLHKVVFIKCEPDSADTFNLSHNSANLRPSAHPLFPTWTQIIDLSVSEEILFNNLKSKTRYNIRLSQKKSVVVKEQSDEKGFAIFQKLYFETCKRQHYHGHTPEYHRHVWNAMKKGIAHILIAYWNDIPLAAYELFYFHKKLYYPYGGSSTEHKNVMAPNLLMWEAIRLGYRLGAKEFDLWGSLPPHSDSINSDWSGFTRFKEGYASRYVEKPLGYDLVLNPLLYNIYNIANRARKLLL